MQRILLIQSRRTPEKGAAEFARFKRAIGERAEIIFESSVNTERDWQNPAEIVRGFDVIIIGGSSDLFFDGGRPESDPERVQAWEVLERMRPLVAHVLEKNIPTLGICLGHQIISEIHGGRVTHDHEQRKMGTYEVTLTEEGKKDRVFGKMPEKFMAQYAHRDSVTSAPKDGTLLAIGPACHFSAIRYGQSLYTVQFHPEVIADDLRGNQEAISEYLPKGKTIEEVVRESPIASTILPTFLAEIGG